MGRFSLEDAITLQELERLRDEERLKEAVHPVESCFEEYPALHVRETFQKLLDNGNPIYPAQLLEGERYEADCRVRVHREDGSFAGIYAFDGERGFYRPVKMFL